MNMQRLRTLLSLLGALSVSILFIGFTRGVDNEPTRQSSSLVKTKPSLALIYRKDKASAEGFKKLLGGAGFSLQPIRLDLVEKTDFSVYNSILIASDTERAWGASAKAVDQAKKPTLGLGEGGYSYFGELSLAIGARHGWHGRNSSIMPVNCSKSPFWTTCKVPAQDGKAIPVYGNTNHVGIFLPNPAEDILLIGREEKNATHYPIVQQGSRYVLWGFTAPPDQMTPIGRELFVALCRYTSTLP